MNVIGSASKAVVGLFLTKDVRPTLILRLVIYAMGFGAVLILRGPVSQLASAMIQPGPKNLLGVICSEMLVASWAIGGTIGWTFLCRRYLDRQPFSGMGLPSPWVRRHDIAAGFGLGAGMMVVVACVQLAVGWLEVEGLKTGFTGWIAAAVLVEQFVHFIATSVCEETAYRGYLLQNVGEVAPVGFAALISGVFFATSHAGAPGFGPGFVIAGTLVSVLLVGMRLVTRSIWLGVGWHLGWDYFEVGLGIAPGFMPFKAIRSGAPFWTGYGVAVEGGALFILVLSAGLVGLWLWADYLGRCIRWDLKLSTAGDLITSPQQKEEQLNSNVLRSDVSQ